MLLLLILPLTCPVLRVQSREDSNHKTYEEYDKNEGRSLGREMGEDSLDDPYRRYLRAKQIEPVEDGSLNYRAMDRQRVYGDLDRPRSYRDRDGYGQRGYRDMNYQQERRRNQNNKRKENRRYDQSVDTSEEAMRFFKPQLRHTQRVQASFEFHKDFEHRYGGQMGSEENRRYDEDMGYHKRYEDPHFGGRYEDRAGFERRYEENRDDFYQRGPYPKYDTGRPPRPEEYRDKFRRPEIGSKYQTTFRKEVDRKKSYGNRFKSKPKKEHATMKDLVFDMYSFGVIRNSRIYDTMLKIDRKHYIVQNNASLNPYKDEVQLAPFGFVISAPSEQARSLEILKNHLKPGNNILDIGSGSGYLSACFAELVGPTGHVTAVEMIPEILQFSQYNIQQGNPELLDRISFKLADGRASYGQHGPYDVIHVGGGFNKYPEIFLLHLKPGGRLLIPLGEKKQMLTIYDKNQNRTIEKKLWGFVHVQQLKSASEQLCIAEVPKPSPMSVALQHYVRKAIQDRVADASAPQTTQMSRQMKDRKRMKKRKRFYNLNFEQRKHNAEKKDL